MNDMFLCFFSKDKDQVYDIQNTENLDFGNYKYTKNGIYVLIM